MKRMLLVLPLVCLNISCIDNQNKKNDDAKKNADFIIENLNNKEVLKEFPEKHFSRQKTEMLINDIKTSCDWERRKGGFKDFKLTNSSQRNEIIFIYDFHLSCDSLKFILTYTLEKKKYNFTQLIIKQL